jgi:hypothetical protein
MEKRDRSDLVEHRVRLNGGDHELCDFAPGDRLGAQEGVLAVVVDREVGRRIVDEPIGGEVQVRDGVVPGESGDPSIHRITGRHVAGAGLNTPRVAP